MGRHAQLICQLVLLITNATATVAATELELSTAAAPSHVHQLTVGEVKHGSERQERKLAAAATGHVHELTLGEVKHGSCTPNAWVDYVLEVDAALTDTNLIFEVEDKGDSYNPEALMVAIWEYAVPSDRAAEHRTERASGKVWSVGMNNECFVVGNITLGIRCSPFAAVDFTVKVVVVQAPISPGSSLVGEVCPGEWVYHYVNTTAEGAGHYGAGHHLRFTIDKDANEGAAVAVTRHLAAPLKTVPPYVSLEYSAEAVSAPMELCNVENGLQYLGIRGADSEGGCMHYTLTAEEFTTDCAELMHSPSNDPAAIADKTLPVEHFERASCGPHQWYDFYFPVTAHMVDVEDNIVFEVEMLAEQYELGGISVHLYQGYIPLDRGTELVSDTPDNGIYSISIPSIELQAGPYYLSVKCGPNPQRFRVVAFEVRGILTGPGDAVHGEICPNEWLYHSIKPSFLAANATAPVASRRRLGRSHRRLAGSGGVTPIAEGITHLQATFNKHEGDFIFMSLNGDHPPTRIQPPSRTMHDYDQVDYTIFCNVSENNLYWIALHGGHHCATYDLAVTQLAANDTRCATGEYSLVPNEVASTGMTELVKERPTYGSAGPGQYVDYFLPLSYPADTDSNLRFQVELMGDAVGRPDALSLLIYNGDEIPTHRQTEIFADSAVDGIWSVLVNVAELSYQLKKAYAASSDSSNSSYASAVVVGNSSDSSSARRRQLAAAPSVGGDAHLTYYVSVRASDSAPAAFKLLASAVRSHLEDGVSVHGEICPGAFIYHHWEHHNLGEKRSAKFRITKHGGDGFFLVRHGHNLDEAPLKIAPPYLHMGYTDEHAYVEYCNASDAHPASVADGTEDHVYVLIVAGEHCLSYEIMAQEQPNDECVPMGHGAAHTTYTVATEVAPHHFVYGSCANNDWTDFKLTLSESDYHYNYLIEVEDLADTHDPTALALYMFQPKTASYSNFEIPNDRLSEQRAERAIDGIYSLAINRHNFHAGTSFISVSCRDVGDEARRFRLVIYQIEEFLELEQEYHGEVSPGQWVYHSYEVPRGVPQNFTFHIVIHTGDFEVVVRHGFVPLKLIPPYEHVDAAVSYFKDTQVCNSAGEKVYLGMLGGLHAASYEIIASALPPGAPCAEPAHALAATKAEEYSLHELEDSVLTLGHCEAEGWWDAFANITYSNLYNNLIFELEDLGHTGALGAVEVYMWMGEIPTSRKSEYFTTRAYNDVYSLSVSMHEFETFFKYGGTTIYFGVKCGPRPVRFRTFVTFVHSHLDTSHVGHGEVCPGAWVYHKLSIDDALIFGSSSGAGDAHRRLAAVGVDVVGGVTRGTPEGRALAAQGDEDGVHVRLHIIKNVGSMNLMLNLNDKPLRLIPSDTTYMEAGDSEADMIYCNVDKYYRNVSTYEEGKMKLYLGINGGDTCASYEIITSTFTTSCSQAKEEAAALLASTDKTVAAHGSVGQRECRHGDADCELSMRHYMRGSCAPHERAPPFVIKVPYAVGVPLDNLVLEVEDLNVEENPSSLSIALYRGPEADGKCVGRTGSCTQEQLQELTPLRTVTSARARIFSFGLSSIEMQEYICGGTCTSTGTFALNMVIRCASSRVRFKAIAILTPLILERGMPVHGEVCPGNWIYHKTLIPDNDKYHDAAGVRFNVHVHQGDIYYIITRWDHAPGFAACNENEVAMSFKRDGQADLCHLSEKFECTFTESDKAAAAANGTELSLIGYVGLYGGTSCAHYTIETERLVNTTCSIATTGTCGEVKACA